MGDSFNKNVIHRQCFLQNFSLYNISQQLYFQKTSGWLLQYETKYSRMDQVKFMEDSL